LNGLGIAEIKLSEVLENSLKRLEAEFYIAFSHSKGKFVLGNDAIEFVQYGTSEGLNEEGRGYPVLRLNEFESIFIKEPSKYCEKIDDATYESLKLKAGDVLICRTNGNPKLVGKSAIVPKDTDFAFASYVFRIRPKREVINPETLTVYLNSKIGRAEIEKYSMVSNQANFSPAKFREIQIPLFDLEFQTRIEELVKAAHEKLEQSKRLYAEAESLLLGELGLRDFLSEPPAVAGGSKQLTQNSSADKSDSKNPNASNAQQNPPATAGGSDKRANPFSNIAVKSFKESFVASGRLDAEFYQPKYDYAFEKLKELKPLAIVPLESLLTMLTNGHTPLRHDLSVGDVAFLTAEHIHDFRVNFDSDKRILTEHHNGEVARTKIETGDLLLTIKGRIGNAAVVENVPRPANINQDVALLRLRDDINAYYIAGFLNSILGKMFINRIATGQINPFLGLGNLRTIPIPLFAPEQMNKIGEHLKNKIHQAFDTQQQSKHLLETAKRGVELAIEQDEQAALELIGEKAGNHMTVT